MCASRSRSTSSASDPAATHPSRAMTCPRSRCSPRSGRPRGVVAEGPGDVGGGGAYEFDGAVAVGEQVLAYPAHRDGGADAAGVVEDRCADGGDARRDVLVGDGIAALARGAELLQQRLAGGGGVLGQGLGRAVLEVLLPELLGLE